ncbi:MAG: hypothetical protein JW951_01420 [Lentisphaerae bacterium]|nr:hypothetical protein [Lentisphaerota bacterium]
MDGYAVGDHVIYHKTKSSPHPGPRAEGVRPSEHGEDYTYGVDKFWTVSAVHADGSLEVVTRTGKRHVLDPRDPNLRKAGVVDNMRYRDRFPDPDTGGRSTGDE